MPVDDASFRLALSQFATGVTVILIRDAAGALAGLTVSSFASVSLRPPQMISAPSAGRIACGFWLTVRRLSSSSTAMPVSSRCGNR